MTYSLPFMRIGLLPLAVAALVVTLHINSAAANQQQSSAAQPAPLEAVDAVVEAEAEEQNSFALDAVADEDTAPEPEAAVIPEPTSYIDWQGSLMFPVKRVEDLLAIYRAYLEKMQNEGEDASLTGDESDIAERTLRILTGTQEGEPAEETLSFSLNSILYDGAENWSIWVNGKRYNREQAMEGVVVDNSAIRVVAASEHSITYEWLLNPQIFSFTEERWNARPDDEVLANSPNVAKNSKVELDKEGRKVRVTLRPNQTFLSQHMVVVEGRRRDNIQLNGNAPQAEILQTGDDGLTPGAPGAPAAPGAPGEPASPDARARSAEPYDEPMFQGDPALEGRPPRY